MTQARAIPLNALPLGLPARVRSLACDRAVRRRLLELGLLPGTQVEVVRRAPLGDPLELRLRGYRLSLRAGEASAIEVDPEGAPSDPRADDASAREKA